jgi:hypothetical protein
MYQKPRFLEELHAIREEMSRDCDYDVDLFAEMARSGQRPHGRAARSDHNAKSDASTPGAGEVDGGFETKREIKNEQEPRSDNPKALG